MKTLKLPQLSKHALIIFLLWAFAPLAWFLLWQDKKYHSWFPKLLWVNGIIFSVIFITQSFVFIPKLEEFYKALNIQMPANATPLAVIILLAFVLLQIPAGMRIQKKIKKHKFLTERYVVPILIIFAIDGFIALSTGVLSAVQSPTALVNQYLMTQTKQIITTPLNQPAVTPFPSPTPTPTPKPLSFNEMSQRYGPCVTLPTLMYHHIEDLEEAKKFNRTGLAVSPENFTNQMNYIAEKGYQVLSMKDLVSFLDNGTTIPSHSLLLTFDDGYDDFYKNAYPVLEKLHLRATMFVPTGLVGNPGYLTWNEISEMNGSGLVLFANHTWSHHAMNKIEGNTLYQEINIPDNELTDHGVGDPKIFAYPYGTVGKEAEARLASVGYKAAFTTVPGKVLCKKMELTLPRVRIGNSSLLSYGI